MTRRPWVVGNRWDSLGGVQPQTLPKVSVIVAHYEQPGELARTLSALSTQDYPRELLEIVVADDGSAGDVLVPPGVTLVRQDDRGFRLAAARNLGARASTGDVLCFLDADTAPEPGYVRALTRLPALLPEAVTVGRRRHADFSGIDAETPVIEAVIGRELPEPAWLAEEYARSSDLLDADDRSYRFVIGAVIACSRRLFEETGGFDESFSTYGGEDWEWAHRMWQAGAVLAHVPTAVAWHDGPEWAERTDSGLERANAQTMTLVSSIPVDGSAPRGLLSAVPDLVVRLRGTHTREALFIAVDSIFTAFPRSRVMLDATSGLDIDDPRIVIDGDGDGDGDGDEPEARVLWELDRPVVVLESAGIAELVAGLGAGDVGTVDLVDSAGSSAGVLHSRRALRRAARWGTAEGFETLTVRAEGVHLLRSNPHVEAWVGGWGGPDRFR